MSISDYPDDYARVVDRVRGYTAEYGGDPEAPEATFYMTVNLREDETAAADEADKFLRQYYGSNIWGDRWGPFGNPKESSRAHLEVPRSWSADCHRALCLLRAGTPARHLLE